ncbi:DegT/DnrJ/EryC1/StrS family aminotransferase [Azospirillum sp.]|uniref:DegT/DnrJ/EryC1/StrS family aminotransferase n=1 Tax=Azospirillum sp. TaxID=34012 RepID=UPI002D60AD0C|nr:DegT/DnrJ/EryC1/StrS family aminotransferase [Azospirillum sp.]HYD70481.1 DegT/DnrJ/EryC1/StrS family aminotransferase [Azospirillum sp.]
MIFQTFPKSTYDEYRDEYDTALRQTLDAGFYILGREVETFEHEFAAYTGVRHALGVANGTQAIELALRALGIGAGDLVLTVSHTAVATAMAVVSTGATPVWVDVDPATAVMDAGRLEQAIAAAGAAGFKNRLKAVIAVHLYGNPVDIPAIMDVCRRHGLALVEDCAQAHGAVIAGRRVGGFGAIGAFSFYPTKNMPAFGDGGAVVTDDAALRARLAELRQYGWKQRYVSDTLGLNSRLDEIHAAMLRVSLRHLDSLNARRRALAATYDQGLAGLPLARPATTSGAEPVYHQYVIQTDRRDALAAFMAERGVHTAIHYPVPVHRQPAFAGMAPVAGPLHGTEALADRILSLPMYPQITAGQATAVATAVQEFFRA